MKPEWILIANATRARLLQRDPYTPLMIIKSFTHLAGRSKVSDLADDRAGHESTDTTYGGAAYTPRVDAKRKEHERFAQELADHLEHGAQQGAYESLTLFASSPFLGELKAHLGSAASRLLSGTHDVDLTAVGPVELERRIAHEMAR